MISLFSDLARALGLAVDAALLQRAAFTHLVDHPSIALAALVIPLVAGASEMLGKAYVLAAQKVGRWRIMAWSICSAFWSGARARISCSAWPAI